MLTLRAHFFALAPMVQSQHFVMHCVYTAWINKMGVVSIVNGQLAMRQ